MWSIVPLMLAASFKTLQSKSNSKSQVIARVDLYDCFPLVRIILSLPRQDQRRQNLEAVNNWAATLAILPLLSGSLALAEDFKLINGKVYKNATISRVEADRIVVRTKTGISKIYFVEPPKDVQDRFHYLAATPITAPRERKPVLVEAKQHEPPKPDVRDWAWVLLVSTLF